MEYKFINFMFDNYLEEISDFMCKDLSIESDIIKESFIKWKDSKKSKPKKEIKQKEETNKKVTKNDTKKGICQFLDEKNNQKCGAKIRGGVGDVCSKHKNKKNDIENSAICIQRDPKTKSWIVLGTNLVVDGPENRQVIGMKNNTKIVKLNQEGIKECKKYKLDYKNEDT